MERVFGKAKDKILDHFNVKDMGAAERAVCQVCESGFFCGARFLTRCMSVIQPKTFRYCLTYLPNSFFIRFPASRTGRSASGVITRRSCLMFFTLWICREWKMKTGFSRIRSRITGCALPIVAIPTAMERHTDRNTNCRMKNIYLE